MGKNIIWTDNVKVELPIRLGKTGIAAAPPTTLMQEFKNIANSIPKKPALSVKVNGSWVTLFSFRKPLTLANTMTKALNSHRPYSPSSSASLLQSISLASMLHNGVLPFTAVSSHVAFLLECTAPTISKRASILPGIPRQRLSWLKIGPMLPSIIIYLKREKSSSSFSIMILLSKKRRTAIKSSPMLSLLIWVRKLTLWQSMKEWIRFSQETVAP